MKPNINLDFFKPFINGKKRHRNYNKCLDVAFHLQFHFDGYFQRPWPVTGENTGDSIVPVNPYFTRLIDERRPSESPIILAYRRKRYQPITKECCGKVTNSLKKIVKSCDWKIDYSKVETPKSLPEENSLYRYMEEDYPKDDSLENWAYKTLVRWLLIDPNAWIVVMPLSFEIEPSEFVRPYAHIIESKDIYDFQAGESVVFLSPYVSTYKTDEGEKHGKIIMYVTKDCYYEARQVSSEDYEIVEHPHNLGELPAWIMGGEQKSPNINAPFYESFVHPMLPMLDNAAIDSSDLDAEKVQHLYSTMWYMQMQSCTSCQGTGSLNKNGKQTICPTCEGRGGMSKSPYRDIEINMNNIMEQSKGVPIPPAGYIEKDTAMVDKMMEIIKDEKRSALSAINMEFLAETPLSESGKAKEIDRDELNNFVYGIAYHLVVELIEPIYYFCNELRYKQIFPNKEVRRKMLPTINVPENFDFLTQKDAEDKLIKIMGSQVSSNIKDLAEMTYLHSKFQDTPEVRDKMMAIQTHDPLAGIESKLIPDLLTAGIAKKEDVVLHFYIKSFIAQLMADDSEFLKKDFAEQKEILYEMAKTKTEEVDASETIKKMAAEVARQEYNPTADVEQKIDNKKTQDPTRKRERNSLDNA